MCCTCATFLRLLCDFILIEVLNLIRLSLPARENSWYGHIGYNVVRKICISLDQVWAFSLKIPSSKSVVQRMHAGLATNKFQLLNQVWATKFCSTILMSSDWKNECCDILENANSHVLTLQLIRTSQKPQWPLFTINSKVHVNSQLFSLVTSFLVLA